MSVYELVDVLTDADLLRRAILDAVTAEAQLEAETGAPAAQAAHAAGAALIAACDEGDVPMLAEDTARITASAAEHAPIALPSDAYEDRLRVAREAVKSDSKRVAQVVKGWLDDEAAA